MSDNKRVVSLDALRIVSMLMIVSLHYFENGLIRETVQFPHLNYFFVWGIEILCSVCVNCYIINTAWFTQSGSFKLHKLMSLWIEIVFVNIVCCVFSILILHQSFGVKSIISIVFPITTNEYWYMSAYFAFYMISPLLGWIVDRISVTSLAKIVVICILLFTVVPFDWAKIDYGYHFVWFVVLFFITSYIKKRKDEFKIFQKRPLFYLAFYFLLCIVMLVLKVTFDIIGKRFGFDSFGSHFRYYTFILNVINSFLIFLCFLNSERLNKTSGKLISKIAALTLSIYLIQLNPFIEKWLWQEVVAPIRFIDSFKMIPHFLISVVAVFSVCLILSWLIKLILRLLCIPKMSKRISGYCVNIYQRLIEKL